ncbi:hypothetical protein [Pontimicrobium sp. SW4]|uniref:Uncharacterized protein n=1 Tax=Pontimicrobium sp. SW4 TaxID=3153519 RepID=A0AAU7BTM1_9FLAO
MFLLFIVGYNILPDFSLNKNDFEVVTGLVSSVKKETYEERRPKDYLFKNIIRERLIITIADRKYHEYYISDIYKDYWNELLKSNLYGKEIVLYLGEDKQEEDPFRIEVDGKVIFDIDVRFKRNLMIIGFTLLLSIYNLSRYFKVGTNSLQIIKKRFVGIRHYFLE